MILSLQNFKRVLIHLFSLFLMILEIFPKYGNTILSPNFGTVVKTGFYYQILNRCISTRLKFCKFKISFKTGNRPNNYFTFKDHVPETLQSNSVYKFTCEAAQLPLTVKPTDI